MEKNSFTDFIMHCCKLSEPELREYLKQELSAAGFSYVEDDYRSPRGFPYHNVHNILFSRGQPKICLVAHTDVCRDHGRKYAQGNRRVVPVVKPYRHNGEIVKVIQDQTRKTQIGGDDRLGVAINTWIALNTGYDMALLFTTDEEEGLLSAREVAFPEINGYELLCQVDRGNHSDQLVVAIARESLCDATMAFHLLSLASSIGLPREPVSGMVTDVYAIKDNFPHVDAVNMTCGYHKSFSDSPEEYIVIQEAKDTLRYVSEIVKDFYLREEALEPIIVRVEEEETPEDEEFQYEEWEDSQEAGICSLEYDW